MADSHRALYISRGGAASRGLNAQKPLPLDPAARHGLFFT